MQLKKFTDNRSIGEAKVIYEQRILDSTLFYKMFGDEFNERSCPCCNSDEYSFFNKFHNLYDISICNKCLTKFVNPAPSKASLNYFYNECKSSKLIADIYKKRAKDNSKSFVDYRMKTVYDIIEKKENNNYNILEVGCGNGSGLNKLKNYLESSFSEISFKFTGVDINNSIVPTSGRGEINYIADDVLNYLENEAQQFDIILHYELIEHLVNPYNFMKLINKACKKDGYVIFTTPNASGLEMLIDHNEYRLLAHAIFPPMHLNAFSTININLFAHIHGFKLFEITTPGQLDVDIINNTKNINNYILEKLKKMDESSQAILQQLCIQLKSSSHMQAIFKK
jgi:2-polyprenyl-6-hydroxyphenyl methylase / 3-demethylubiquinone-9 3-methyltransferase